MMSSCDRPLSVVPCVRPSVRTSTLSLNDIYFKTTVTKLCRNTQWIDFESCSNNCNMLITISSRAKHSLFIPNPWVQLTRCKSRKFLKWNILEIIFLWNSKPRSTTFLYSNVRWNTSYDVLGLNMTPFHKCYMYWYWNI
jgi:hypothetical protein